MPEYSGPDRRRNNHQRDRELAKSLKKIEEDLARVEFAIFGVRGDGESGLINRVQNIDNKMQRMIQGLTLSVITIAANVIITLANHVH